jgi:phosphoglycolate phosphatase-like HAD superfamily hydrolase
MNPMPQFPSGQTLLIDADDTLWENNIYFERAIAAFIGYLDHHEYSAAEVRKALNAQERATILAHGYGLTSFTRSLVAVYERLSPAPVTAHNIQRVRSFARSIAEQEIELLPGVADTLAELAKRHRLILMTKGDQAEQANKLAAPGSRSIFPPSRSSPRKTLRYVSRSHPSPRAVTALKLDDRQQHQERHQPRPRRRPARRLSLPQRHLGSGTRRARPPASRSTLTRTRFVC